jgi:hypothetical protein
MSERCTCFWRPSITCPEHGGLARLKEYQAKQAGRSRKVVERFDERNEYE